MIIYKKNIINHSTRLALVLIALWFAPLLCFHGHVYATGKIIYDKEDLCSFNESDMSRLSKMADLYNFMNLKNAELNGLIKSKNLWVGDLRNLNDYFIEDNIDILFNIFQSMKNTDRDVSIIAWIKMNNLALRSDSDLYIPHYINLDHHNSDLRINNDLIDKQVLLEYSKLYKCIPKISEVVAIMSKKIYATRASKVQDFITQSKKKIDILSRKEFIEAIYNVICNQKTCACLSSKLTISLSPSSLSSKKSLEDFQTELYKRLVIINETALKMSNFDIVLRAINYLNLIIECWERQESILYKKKENLSTMLDFGKLNWKEALFYRFRFEQSLLLEDVIVKTLYYAASELIKYLPESSIIIGSYFNQIKALKEQLSVILLKEEINKKVIESFKGNSLFFDRANEQK